MKKLDGPLQGRQIYLYVLRRIKMNPKKNSGNPAAQLAFCSVLAGAASILFCFTPLVQFPLGMIGITLALISRVQNDKHFMPQAVAGLIASAAGIVFSLITFSMVMFVYQVILPLSLIHI